MSVVLAGLHT